ncbi:hypothetical protein ACQ4PT_026840 [Festuca glaucescens]
MREKLSINDDLTSAVRLFEIADRCTKAEEGCLFVHDGPEEAPAAPPTKNKSKEHKSRGGCRGGGHTGGRGEYNRKEDYQQPPPQANAQQPQPPPQANNHRAEENLGGYQEPRGYIGHILGGAQAPLSKRHFKQLSREIAAVQPSANTPRLKWSQYKISFDASDHPKSTRTVGTLPLVCTPTINNIDVTKTLIDGGANLNVISVETFEKMQVPYDRLMPTRPFFGVTDGSTTPLGQVCLPVTFGTCDNYRTEYIDFDVVHIGLPYNTILGYPTLAKSMAVAHHTYNIIKLPGCGGTITIRCDEKDAMRFVEHVYKEAAATFPADEDLVEHSGGLARRKQLVSQEWATAKRAATTEFPAEPSIGFVRKKRVAPPEPSSPGKNPAEPAKSTKCLAEASVGSARKMHFMQERTATKKIPLNADGLGATLTIDMSGVSREVIEHHLAVCPNARPVKQKMRRQAPEKQNFIIQEVEKLKQLKLIREVTHPTWTANPVVALKGNSGGHLCVDFINLNKACPKDPYLLPRIDQIVDSTVGCDLLCFLDAFSGYHQIKMAKEDEEKTNFITPCGVYCYVCMPFGLKNAGATFQRLMRKALGEQMGRNAEAYVDDIVVKTRKKRTLIEDLEETFANLRKVNIKLNPAKCAFGVPSGKLMGFLVSHRGIEANPDKVKAIEEMQPPRNLKEMQRLAGCMAVLGRFIARSGERALPFFKLMKKTRNVVLIVERKKLVITKENFTSEESTKETLPEATLATTLAEVTPREILAEVKRQETLAEEENIGEQPKPPEEPPLEDPTLVQHPIYFVSTVLRDARERYTMQQKLLYTLLVASRKLRHYFQGHPITVVTSYPLEQVLCNPNVTGRVAEWAIELQPFELTFETTKVIKSKALAEFTAEWTDP